MYKIDIESELRQHLDTNEKLLWIGRPKTGIIFQTIDTFLIPFSLIWCGFAIFWTYTAMAMGAPAFFVLFGVFFVIIGLIFVFGRFIIDAQRRKNTIYGITENRIIIKSGIMSKKVESLNIKTLSNISYTEKGDGSGSVLIGQKNFNMIWGNGMSWFPGIQMTPQLEAIADVRNVYNRIIELQNRN